jgi:hypothetical protein
MSTNIMPTVKTEMQKHGRKKEKNRRNNKASKKKRKSKHLFELLLLYFRTCNCNHLGIIIANVNYLIFRWCLYLRPTVSVNVLGWEGGGEYNQNTFLRKMALPCKMIHVDTSAHKIRNAQTQYAAKECIPVTFGSDHCKMTQSVTPATSRFPVIRLPKSCVVRTPQQSSCPLQITNGKADLSY